jgi:hypothetical protein
MQLFVFVVVAILAKLRYSNQSETVLFGEMGRKCGCGACPIEEAASGLRS